MNRTLLASLMITAIVGVSGQAAAAMTVDSLNAETEAPATAGVSCTAYATAAASAALGFNVNTNPLSVSGYQAIVSSASAGVACAVTTFAAIA